MAEIHYIGCVTKLDLPPDQILEQAVGQMQGVLVLGYDHEGKLYAASSYADGGTLLWLMEHCKHELLKHGGIIAPSAP